MTSDHNNLCLGIDFGTTNSCLSIWHDYKNIIISDIDGSDIIPTLIEINTEKKIIGKEAFLRKEIFKDNKDIFLVYEIKKLLGKKFSEINKNNINLLSYDLICDDEDNIIIFDKNNNIKYYPQEIAIHIFMSFKLKAESFLSKYFNKEIIINDVVISVPAYFNKNQREIIKNSAENSGFNVLRLINEPTAAAICYGLGKNTDNLNIIVFDFGGGTLDVSLLNINNGVYEVIGSCGNNNLGGSDFDLKIMEYCLDKFIENNNLPKDNFIKKISNNNIHKLKMLSEQAKISLSDNNNTKIKIEKFYEDIDLFIEINRDTFNEIINNLLLLIIKPINDLLELCDIEKNNINEIIMVGGMTKMPIIRYNIEKFFNSNVNYSINPDNVVSIGAAIHGFMINNKNSIDDKILLIDRTSLSVGVETSGGIMDVLISRGSIIPIKKTKKYSTDQDYVDSIDIKIFEGERKFTKDNFLIGDFSLTGIEKQKRGIPEINITFSIDSNNIIKVTAEDINNPLNKKCIQVSANKQNLSEEKIQEIINNANILNEKDKIDKFKKESYLSILDDSLKILENINTSTIKIPENIKDDIINNLNEIINWLENTNYNDIAMSKYKEILHDYKINYSIYLLQNSSELNELESANELDQGVEIFEDNETIIKYKQTIDLFRNIIDEYDNIKKQIKITKLMNNNNISEENFNNIEKLFNDVYNFTSDNLLNFYINKDFKDEKIKELESKLINYDSKFKDIFNTYNNEFNILNNILSKIKNKEENFLTSLENINDENSNEFKNINDKLDIIIEIEANIYKINNSYIKPDFNKLNNFIEIIEKL
jgi:molecular chaperone DnaK (HSP70)